jgi:NAD+ kinase
MMRKSHRVQRILLVRKTTNLEWHGGFFRREVAAGRIPASDLDRLQRAHDEHHQTLDGLRDRLRLAQIDFTEISRETEWPATSVGEKFDAVLTVGGDGTLLTASHKVLDSCMMVGVRSSRSSVGYLCAYDGAMLDRLVANFCDGQITATAVARIRAVVRPAGGGVQRSSAPVLNDFLYSNTNPAATTRYRLRLNDAVEDQKSSGIWISTATGSSAVISAAGGERVSHTDRRAQYKVREPFTGGKIKPKRTWGFFDPVQDVFEIENRCERAFLALDGQHGEVPLKLGDLARISAAPDLMLVLPDVAQR